MYPNIVWACSNTLPAPPQVLHVDSLNPPLPLHFEHSLVRFNLTSFSHPKAASSKVRFNITLISSPFLALLLDFEPLPNPEKLEKPPPNKSPRISSRSMSPILKPWNPDAPPAPAPF